MTVQGSSSTVAFGGTTLRHSMNTSSVGDSGSGIQSRTPTISETVAMVLYLWVLVVNVRLVAALKTCGLDLRDMEGLDSL